MSVISCVQGIRDELATRLNEVETDNTDTYTNWINFSIQDLAISFPGAPFLQTSADITLSSGVRIYPAMLSNAAKVNTVTDPLDSKKLTFLSPEEFDAYAPSATQGGNPNIFTIRGLIDTGWWEFFPVPGSNLTLHFDYEQKVPVVSAGSATLAIPTKYYELPILYGEKMGWKRKLKFDLSRDIDVQYQTLKNIMMQDLMRQTTQMPRIKSVREWADSQRVLNDPISNEFFQQNP